MITRIEIDGFKSFEDFSLDLPPFLVLIGTNASGKSNLLDALRFLAVLAHGDLYDAIEAVRGDAVGLFRRRGDGTSTGTMRFAIEMITTFEQRPPIRALLEQAEEQRRRFGTCWRYELTISLEADGLSPRIADESIVPLPTERGDRCPLNASPAWREAHVRPGNQVPEFRSLSEIRELAGLSPTQSALGMKQAGSVVRGVGSELRSIAAFQLEDAALRRLSVLGGRPELLPNGEGLPAYLARLRKSSASDGDPEGVLADIRADLVRIVREVTSFHVVEDRVRRDIRIEFEGRHIPRFGADVASDGTLRVLALLAALNDPDRSGVVAIEEPENGVFPERLRELLATMRRLVSDPAWDDLSWPLRQALVTSHSPVVLDAVPRENIVFLDNVTKIEDGVASRITRARRLVEPGRPARPPGEEVPRVTEGELDQFRAGLETVSP
ncbi:AAA family ATPase [Sphaerimonospora cavernae]|uniref:AAA family ATPase n=1 Tax=Sphaerimonospora cavernae TaxID=1740611 RepID=A0ABV6U5W4_9ACTN